ncbi:phytoene/squalene synthase family protein, partial [Xanthomonas perforans]|nr:phytoene/squalene synthase family protein [Xanthomonas perforans]
MRQRGRRSDLSSYFSGPAMSQSSALDSFLDKWATRWPE